jgi:hypothetical protein
MRAVAAAIVLFALALGQGPPPTATAIYSSRADDPWNRIFALLFTRTVSISKTDEFADAEPFVPMPAYVPPFLRLRASTRTFDRYEEGDRAIEALYPSFITQRGVDHVLSGPPFQALGAALTEALDERTPRAPLDRALMQADLWSAFDALVPVVQENRRPRIGRTQAEVLLPLLGRLIGKLALTPAEIAALPDHYVGARASFGLPDLFSPHSEWMELVMGQYRLHDEAADFRRVSRVFMKPLTPPADEGRFLASLPNVANPPVAAAVLVMETLLVDSRGRVVPSRLISDIQVRSITRERRRGSSASGDAVVDEYELSRRKLRSRAAGGGFVHFDSIAPAYLAVAGNDYGFATPMWDHRSETVPLLTTLRKRCGMCHGMNGATFMMLNLKSGPGKALPPVVRLRQPNDDRALRAAAAKEERTDFKRLIEAAGLRR